jgi:hypothetical protein
MTNQKKKIRSRLLELGGDFAWTAEALPPDGCEARQREADEWNRGFPRNDRPFRLAIGFPCAAHAVTAGKPCPA